MNKSIDINFAGIRNSDSDDACEAGEVSLACNLSSISPISTPIVPNKIKLNNIDGCKIIVIHSGNNFKNVFVYNNTSKKVVCYKYSDLENVLTSITSLCEISGEEPTSYEILGNIVVLCFSNTTKYLYRKGNSYIVRDNKLPSFSMSIKAVCRIVSPLSDDSLIHTELASSYPDGLKPVEYFHEDISTKTLTKKGELNNRKYENDAEKLIIGRFNDLLS